MSISKITYIASLVTAALLTVAFETGLLPTGVLASGTAAEYWVQIVCVALTLISLPLVLKWRRIAFINRLFSAGENANVGVDANAYANVDAEANVDGVEGVAGLRSDICRISVLSVPLYLNVICYYLFGTEPTFAYMALMVLVGFAFIWPQGSR